MTHYLSNMPYKGWHYLRCLATICCLGVLGAGAGPRPFTPSSAEQNEEVPRWAINWSSGPKLPCRRSPTESGPGSKVALYEREVKALALLAERLAERGFQCSAAEELLHLAVHLKKADTAAARQALSRALTLALQGDDAPLLARISQELASLESNEQNARRALEMGLAASFLWRQAKDFEEWATSRYDLGVLLLWMGRFDEADDLLNELLRSLESAGNCCQALIAPTLTILGRINIAKGELIEAESLLKRARDARKASNFRGLAATLDALCRLRIEQRAFRQAESLNRTVLGLVRGELRSEANALATKAEIHLGLNQASEAVALARRARSLIEKSGAQDPNLDLHSFFIEALAHRSLGHHHLADASMEALMARLEAYRQADQGALTIPFFAARRRYVDAWVEDLVSEGRTVEAFDVTEWTRARGLLDRLVWPPSEVRARTSPALLQMDRDLRTELAYIGTQLETLTNERTAVELGSRALRIRLSLMSLEAEMRQTAGVLAVKPIGLKEAQRLLGEETLVLGYWLGEDRSVVWALEAGRIDIVADLPGREALERTARRTRELLTKGEVSGREAHTELQALAEVLLSPVAERLHKVNSIVIIPDGALAEIPFAALPQPIASGQFGGPLIERAPVTVVHSLSVLAAIRAKAEERKKRQSLTFAAMADPVYGPQDPRFPVVTSLAFSKDQVPRLRLEGTAREARSVLGRVPKAKARLYLGVDASRQNVLEGFLDQSRFVHIGAHADLHWNNPDLSAIYLSTVDDNGHAVDGALRLQDLEHLRLAADLVVLGGCKTGLGRSYLGEGPLALPRGFLLAGAASVVATLWQVGDEPTSIFFERFWKGVLEEGLSPASALQKAQLELAHSIKWKHPTYWAGFVLLGDWSG